MILGGSVHFIKDNAESLEVANKEAGLEVNGDKTTYIIISRDQNTGKSHNVKSDFVSFEGMEEYKYLGTNLTNQNFIQEEIRSR
jgi:hypothetical protein